MIVSASGRTDIPALYSEWFIRRIRAGYCLVPSPSNARQLTNVSLSPDEVEAIVFWSKNPAPLMPYLEELDKMGFRYYFQFTLNDYPVYLERGVPSLNDRLSTFLNLSRHIGPLRVVWRYDPIIISNLTPVEFHVEAFSRLAQTLKGATRRVMISIMDFYPKIEPRLSSLEKNLGFSFDRRLSSSQQMPKLLKTLADISRRNDIDIFTCGEERDYSQIGIPRGRCIDNEILREVWSLDLSYRKDLLRRDSCLCMVSKDIGINDTCIHGCSYCYATVNHALAVLSYNEHDPDSPLPCGEPDRVELLNAATSQKRHFSEG